MAEIFCQNVGILALGPGPTGPLPRKKKFWDMAFWQRCCKKIFGLFYLSSPEIIGVEFCHRQTDRQNFDTVYGWVCVFFSSQNFLPPYSLRSQGDYFILSIFEHVFTPLNFLLQNKRLRCTLDSLYKKFDWHLLENSTWSEKCDDSEWWISS